MKKYILSIDQGTTSTRAILFNKQGNIIGIEQKELQQIYPNDEWIEHDSIEIWNSTYEVVKNVIKSCNVNEEEIDSIGITNQRETTILWDKQTGEPVYNAIVWQCKRTSDICEKLKESGYELMIQEKTGLVIDAYFSATKIKWILENVPKAKKLLNDDNLLFGTVDSWILWKLTSGKIHATDYTNASRTMLYNINELKWDEEILNILNIPKTILPKVFDSSHIYATVDESILNGNIPIAGIAGDQQAALFGQCCFEEGMIKNTFGTGCFILMNTGKEKVVSKNGLLSTIAWGINGEIEYALEGSVFIAGAAIQWLRDDMHVIDDYEDVERFARKVDNSDGVYVVPTFVGLGTPYWNPYAKGVVVGLTRKTTKEHFIRATLESLAYQSNDVLNIMQQDSQKNIKSIKVDGGGSKNNLLLEFSSNITNIEVIRHKIVESTALGVAFLAGLATGFYSDKSEIIDLMEIERVFKPTIDDKTRDYLISGWKSAIACAIYFEEKTTK